MFSLSRASNNSIRNKVIVETEIAGLRGAVGQYNVIQTLPNKSVAAYGQPMWLNAGNS